jgi:hypothetical protein
MSAFRTLTASLVALISTGAALAAPIGLSKGVEYKENFDTLASSGTDLNFDLAGWSISESGARANGKYSAGTGSDNTGDVYSFGASGSTDRALGSLSSGSLSPMFGANFVNNTGATITSLLISYVGEQWRSGATGRADRLDFQYSLNATSLTTGLWTDFDLLDFSSPNTTATLGALNGNVAANRTAISSTIANLAIGNGSTVWIRWVDVAMSGSNDGLAIDDFSLRTTTAAALPEPAGLALVAVALAGAVFSRRRTAR